MIKENWTIIYYTADASVFPFIHKSFYEKSNPSANILYADGREYFLPRPHSSYKVKDVNSNVVVDFSKMALHDSRRDRLRYILVRNNDKFLRDWLKDNFHMITTTNVAFFEWDVLLNKQLPNTNVNGFTSWRSAERSHSNWSKWPWLKETVRHGKNIKTVVSPFGGFYSTRDFVKEMISSKYDYLYNKDIFCESRTSILVNIIDVKTEEDKEIFNQPSPINKPEFLNREYENIDEVPIGCFHPIKKNILAK